MGARGPKPGFRTAKKEGAAKPLPAISADETTALPAAAPAGPATPAFDAAIAPQATTAADAEYASWMVAKITAQAAIEPAEPATREESAFDRENPERQTGEALRALAHRRGLSLSAMVGMSDEKIRRELNVITYRQYSEAE